VAAPGKAHYRADSSRGAHVEAFAPAIAAAGRSAIVAWQDHRHGAADLYAARVTATKAGHPVRVDDTGAKGWNQWRPAVAVSGRFVIAAWEDERDGPAQIFVARAPAKTIR
jgi:hypothetical protein